MFYFAIAVSQHLAWGTVSFVWFFCLNIWVDWLLLGIGKEVGIALALGLGFLGGGGGWLVD